MHCEICRGLAPANCPACVEVQDAREVQEPLRAEDKPRDPEDDRARFNHWRL